MTVLAPEKSYIELRNKVKLLLADALKRKVIGIEELAAILFIFQRAESTYELEAFLEIFNEAFPILKQFEHERRKEVRSNLEEKIKPFVSKLIKKDPLRAALIAKDALHPEMTWEELKKKYPEINE